MTPPIDGTGDTDRGTDRDTDSPGSSRIDDAAADAIARAFGVGSPPAEEPVRHLPAPLDDGRIHVAWERPRLPGDPADLGDRPPVDRTRAANGSSRAGGPPSAAGAAAAPPGRPPRFVPPGPTAARPGHALAVALRSLLRQRRRLALSTVAVALGVGYLAGSLSLLHRVGNGLAAQSGRSSESADYVIEGSVSLDTPLEYVRRLVPDSIVEPLRRIPGVAAVEPRLESSAIIIPADGEAVVSLGLTERPLGANWPQDAALNPYDLRPGGRPPVGDDEVVIDGRSAATAGVGVDDTVVIATKVTTMPFRVTGIVELDADQLPEGSSLALFALPAARRLFDLNADDNAIAIRLADDADRRATVERISAILPFGSELADGDTHAAHRQRALAKSFTLVRVLLIAFAVLAVVVGGFTVANSMALLFEHRRRGFALLRVVGASSAQLRGAAAAEAAIAGAGAGIVGIALGLAIGLGIEAALRSLGSPVPVAGSPITWWIPPLAVVVGIVTTVAAGIAPAHAAATAAPVEALGPPPAAARGRRRTLRVAAAAIAALAAAATGAVLGGPVAAAGAAGGTVVAGAALLAVPLLLGRVVTATTGAVLGRNPGLRHVATARSDQARLRTSSTAAALMLAVAIVSGLGVLARSFVDSLTTSVDGALRADLVVDSGTLTRGGLAGDLIPRLRALPGVAAVSGWRTGTATVAGSTFRIAGMDGASVFQLLDLDLAETPPSTLPVDGIALSEATATAAGLRTGDRTPVQFASGAVRDMRVVAIYRSPLSLLLGEAIVDSGVLAEELGQSVDILAFVGLAPEADAGAVEQVREVARRAGAKSVLRPEQLVSRRVELLRGFGRVIQWMLLFSVVLALVGVANTLQLGVHERRRELGLLRAVGGTRRQVVELVVAEAVALSVVGTVAGTALGVGAAGAAVAALGDLGLTTFSLPVPTLAWVAAAALLLGVLGAAVPALRAASTPVLEALGETEGRERTIWGTRRRGSVASSGTEPRSEHDRGATSSAAPPSAAPPSAAPPSAASSASPAVEAEVDQAWADDHVSRIVTPTPASQPEAPVQPEDAHADMTDTCFNCGHDPGDEDRCAVCGAARLTVPGPLFSLGGSGTDDAPAATPDGDTWLASEQADDEDRDAEHRTREADARPRPLSFAPDADDEITDAEIIEDTEPAPAETEPELPPDLFSSESEPPTVPPPPFSAEPEPPATVEDGTPAAPSEPAPPPEPFAADERSSTLPLASIFDEPPDPREQPRSPFGQFANDDGVTDPARGKWSTQDPDEELIAQALADAVGGFGGMGGPPRAPAPPAPPAAPPAPPISLAPGGGPPPAFAATGSAVVDGAPLAPPAPAAAVEADRYGLAGAIARLSAAAQSQCAVAFSVAGALLGPQESVVGAVAGQSLGVPTVVVATTDRVLVVGDRRWVPVVESFALDGLTVLGRHAHGTASLTFSDPERLVTVDQVADVALAIELVGTVRALGSGTEF